MGTLTLVRHGQASLFADGEHGVTLSADYDRLSTKGEAQAKLLGEHWATQNVTFDRAIVGPRKRQADTGAIVRSVFVAQNKPFPELEPMPCFDEMHAEALIRTQLPNLMQTNESVRSAVAALGSMLGDREDALKRFQRVFEAVMGLWLTGEIEAEGVESFSDFCTRVDSGLGQLREGGGKGANVVVFTSAGTIAAAMRGALDLPNAKVLDLAGVVKNASLTELTFSRTRVTPTLFNAVGHLPSDLWTHR
ncbi:MAG: histidine phosphatase family protein [Polyangiales bacterium]